MSVNVGIVASAMINAAGVGTEQVMAATQAGLCLYQESSLLNSRGVPFKMAWVPEACLPVLDANLKTASPKGRYKRMMKLVLAALDTFPQKLDVFPPLYLALPERIGALPFAALEPFLKDLHQRWPMFDLEASKVFPGGRAAGASAIAAALEACEAGEEVVLVGGVDSAMDLALMNRLNKDKRLLTGATNQGYVPGEGAAFLLLDTEVSSREVCLSGAATAEEPGHLYSEETCKAEGLLSAVARAGEALGEPAKTVFCGLTGENIAIKEWGITASKSPLISPEMLLSHPAENFGDLGAATIPTLVALAVGRLKEKPSSAPALVWAASDYALRGAVTLAVAP